MKNNVAASFPGSKGKLFFLWQSYSVEIMCLIACEFLVADLNHRLQGCLIADYLIMDKNHFVWILPEQL